MTDVILASGSATRQALLKNAGVTLSVDVAQVDESALIESLTAEGAKPRDIADVLAELKAVKVSGRHPGAMVIGADQVLSVGAQIFQKPADLEAAGEQLRALRGKTHVLSSAVCVARDGSVIWREVREARLTMRDFSEGFLREYLAEAGGTVLGSVGGYQVEGFGLQLFSRIDGDHFTILGLPLLPLVEFLRTHGIVKT